MPKFVEPAVATTANTAAPCSASAARTSSPRSTPSSAGRTGTTSTSITRAADAIEECASALQTIVHRAGASEPRLREREARVLAGGDEGREVAESAALHEHAAGGRGQSELVREPREHFVLGVHRARAFEPGAAVEGARRDHEIERGGGLRRCGRDEREVLRVVGGDARRGEDVLEQGERLGGAQASLVDRAPGEACQFDRRERLVERGLIVEDAPARVLEHEVDEGGVLVGGGVHPCGVRGSRGCRGAGGLLA